MSEFIKKIKLRRNILIILGAILVCLIISVKLVDIASTQVIEIQPGESKTIEIKQNKKLKIKVEGKKVYIASSNKNVAVIKKNNIVKTKDVGIATISIMGTGVESELTLIVKKNLNDPNPVMDQSAYPTDPYATDTTTLGTDQNVQTDMTGQTMTNTQADPYAMQQGQTDPNTLQQTQDPYAQQTDPNAQVQVDPNTQGQVDPNAQQNMDQTNLNAQQTDPYAVQTAQTDPNMQQSQTGLNVQQTDPNAMQQSTNPTDPNAQQTTQTATTQTDPNATLNTQAGQTATQDQTQMGTQTTQQTNTAQANPTGEIQMTLDPSSINSAGDANLYTDPADEIKSYDISDRVWNDDVDLANLVYIIGAVESGGQIYGNRDYGCYIEPETNSKKEKTITIGWAQFYGNNARKLLKKIYKADKELFLSIDPKKKVKKMLKKNWEKLEWKPNKAQKNIIIELITTKTGKDCQDAMFLEEMVDYVKHCKSRFTDNAWAIHMYCEIANLGGEDNAIRIFKACKGNYTLDNIMAMLREDQKNDKNNEVGDKVYWDRHEVCCDFLQRNCA